MKLRKSVFAAIAATLLIAVSMQAKDEMKRIYIFGFASSFNDSIVCFTDVQAVDSAWLNSKNHFLVSRENYSYQLRDYLEGEGYKHPTCMISYSTNLKKLTKKYNKMRNSYTAQPKKSKNKSGMIEDAAPKYQVKSSVWTVSYSRVLSPTMRSTKRWLRSQPRRLRQKTH